MGTDVVTTIIDVARAGVRLSLLLNAVCSEVSDSGLEVSSISKGITLFASMLKQTGMVLQQIDSVHSEEAVETAKQISEECTMVFNEINEMLDRCSIKLPDNAYAPSLQQRFRWCFKKHRVLYLLGQLESMKLSLSVMLQILQLGKLMAATSKR